jgi:hypothetical protein
VSGACGRHGRGDKLVQGFGGKSRRKKPTWKTKSCVRGWDQNGQQGDWLGGCGVDSPGSG